MGSTALKRSFEPQPDEREPSGVQFSREREPWRFLRSSLAIQFTSKRKGGWSPDQLSSEVRAEITSALEARRSIIRSYSEIHSALFEFLQKAGVLPPPAKQFGWMKEDKFAYARQQLTAGESFSPHGPASSELIGEVEALSKRVNLVVHGFVEVREERSGEIRFLVELWREHQSFTCAELKAEAAALEQFSRAARDRLAVLAESLQSRAAR